ncbi:LuxR C-terminal-related transcriptional regulator [Lacisediminihabitans sp. FW035]
MTTFDTDEYLRGALRAGASGFLLKDAGPRLLVEAVRAAANGDALVSPSITVRLLDEIADSLSPTPVRHDLSPRELDVVRSIAQGQTNEAIAADLFVAITTIKNHARSISVKLGVRNRVEIAAWAWRHRLVP